MARCTKAFRRSEKVSARSGFSLIELVIVIVIIGTVAAIAIPRMSNASDKAKAHALAATVRHTQNALDLFKEEHEGLSPAHTPSGLVVSNISLMNRLLQKSDIDGVLTVTGAYGPYLQRAPVNPFTTNTEIRISSAQTLANSGFRYDPDTFILYPDNSSWTGSSEQTYKSLGSPKTVLTAPASAAALGPD